MNDAEFDRQMLRRLSGAMSEAESRAFEEVLRAEPARRRRFALWEGSWQGAGGPEEAAGADLKAPPGLRTRVVARAAQAAAGQRQWQWSGRPRRSWAGGLASAILVLALGVALGMRLTPVSPASGTEERVAAALPNVESGAEDFAGSKLALESSPQADDDAVGEASFEDLQLAGQGLGEAGLAALEELFAEADAS